MVDTTGHLLLECHICMESKGVDSISFLPCIHFLCSTCHEKLKKNECPFCRNKLREEESSDSYDERENEYNDVEFEMLVLEPESRRRRRRKRKNEKKIMKLLKDNREVIVSINRNEYHILSTIED